jgi:hypothetical protein
VNSDRIIAVVFPDERGRQYVTRAGGSRLLGRDRSKAERFTAGAVADFVEMNGASYVAFMGATAVDVEVA